MDSNVPQDLDVALIHNTSGVLGQEILIKVGSHPVGGGPDLIGQSGEQHSIFSIQSNNGIGTLGQGGVPGVVESGDGLLTDSSRVGSVVPLEELADRVSVDGRDGDNCNNILIYTRERAG